MQVLVYAYWTHLEHLPARAATSLKWAKCVEFPLVLTYSISVCTDFSIMSIITAFDLRFPNHRIADFVPALLRLWRASLSAEARLWTVRGNVRVTSRTK